MINLHTTDFIIDFYEILNVFRKIQIRLILIQIGQLLIVALGIV